jgi:ParB family chromosome partitioning protein
MSTTPPDVASRDGRLEHVAPSTLTFGTNVRLDEKIDRTFVSSIKQHGVLTPITVTEDEEGRMTVLLGNRRTRAAIETGREWIPAYVIPVLAGEAERIVDQLVENDQRASLDPAEHAQAYQQLALFGISADGIRRRTNAPKGRVEQGLAIAASAAASKAASEHQLSFDQAAAIAEFEGDESTVAELTAFARDRPDQILHAAQRKRDELREREERAALEANITAAGVELVDTVFDMTYHRLGIRHLYHDAELQQEVEIGDVADHPGLRAGIEYVWGLDSSTGRRESRLDAVYGIEGWAECTKEDGTPQFFTYDYYQPKVEPAPLTEEQRADELAEKRLAKENTKAWVAAFAVRQEWVRDLLQRRSLPSDHAAITALALAWGSVNAYRNHPLACELLQLTIDSEYSGAERAIRDYLIERPIQAPHVSVAIAVAVLEKILDERKGWQEAATPTHWYFRLYLKQLASWGYPASDLEQTIIDGEA